LTRCRRCDWPPHASHRVVQGHILYQVFINAAPQPVRRPLSPSSRHRSASESIPLVLGRLDQLPVAESLVVLDLSRTTWCRRCRARGAMVGVPLSSNLSAANLSRSSVERTPSDLWLTATLRSPSSRFVADRLGVIYRVEVRLHSQEPGLPPKTSGLAVSGALEDVGTPNSWISVS